MTSNWRANNFSIEKPKVEGAYSVDCDRKYANHLKNLKYLTKIPKEIKFDLNDGEYVDKPPYVRTERMDQMTSFVMQHKDLINKDKRIDADLFCFRGVLRIIMATPYKRKNPWAMHAIKYKGTIYMCMNSEQKSPVKATTKVEQYGFKFESYVCYFYLYIFEKITFIFFRSYRIIFNQHHLEAAQPYLKLKNFASL